MDSTAPQRWPKCTQCLRTPEPAPLKPGAIQLFGVKEAAEYCGLAARTIKYHIYESGELQADALIGHSLVFTKETLDDFLKRRRPVGRPKSSSSKAPPSEPGGSAAA